VPSIRYMVFSFFIGFVLIYTQRHNSLYTLMGELLTASL